MITYTLITNEETGEATLEASSPPPDLHITGHRDAKAEVVCECEKAMAQLDVTLLCAWRHADGTYCDNDAEFRSCYCEHHEAMAFES